MIVVVNGGADSGVVLVPFVSLDFAVTVFVTEVLEELQEDLILSLLATLDLRMHAAVVNSSEVGGSDFSAAISVELKESLVDHSLSLGIERALQTFSIRQVSGVVTVNKMLPKKSEYLRGFQRGTHRS